MAIDTPSKRRRVLGYGLLPGVIVPPVPDGSIDTDDRAGLAGVYYSGSEPIPPEPEPDTPVRGLAIPADTLVSILPGVLAR